MEMQREDFHFAPKSGVTWSVRHTMWMLAITAGVSVAFATASLLAENPGLTMVYSLITLLVCIYSVRFLRATTGGVGKISAPTPSPHGGEGVMYDKMRGYSRILGVASMCAAYNLLRISA